MKAVLSALSNVAKTVEKANGVNGSIVNGA